MHRGRANRQGAWRESGFPSSDDGDHQALHQSRALDDMTCEEDGCIWGSFNEIERQSSRVRCL
jgi:hypothetical protein